MATLSDPPSGAFRLSMLVNDTRYRSLTFQFIALVIVIGVFAWLGSNLLANLRAAGLNISYDFLGQSSNYDINQTLIDYSSRSTHWRAALVGVLNTLLVAFLACITATIIGVIAGVLRLSPNWLVRKLMAGYVEAFRNVPVLIWIIIIFTIMTAVLPAPSAFRGEDPAASMLFGAFAFTNRGLYLPAPVWGPGSLVVGLVFLASIIGVFVYRRYARKLLFDTGKLLPTGWPSLAILILPTLLVFLLMGRPISLDYPELAGFNFQGGIQILGSLIALWWALAIYTGRLHRRKRARRHPGGQQRAGRGRSVARPAPAQDHEPRGPAAGAARHHPAADLELPQHHQELVTRDRGRLYGHHRYAGRHHPQPDRQGDRMHPAADGVLPCHQPRHLRAYERLQQRHATEGALRCRTHISNPSATCAIRCCPRPRRRSARPAPCRWLRANLFSSVANAALTIAAFVALWYLLSGVLPWILNGVWEAPSIRACREILNGETGGCFAVLAERWNQLLFGFQYPSELYWRPTLAFLLLFVAIAPVLFSKVFPARMLVFSALYPFIAYFLIWGGSVLVPVFALLGLAVGYLVYSRLVTRSFAAGFFGGIVATFLFWWLSGFVPSQGMLSLQPVASRDMGGFMLNLILGTVCVSLSIPFGIALALGRQSDMPIIKWICIVFIEFIRGVPLITLLFVANVVLAYFLPPGTNFDLILRVIIMITMFASAYIAEVIRGGLAALPNGQYEAGDSLGLDYAQKMRLVILPQALKISIPGIVNVAVGLFKDTTLVSVISMFDLVGMIRGPILASTEWNGVYWELLGFAALLFFVVCYGISQYSQWLERQLRTDHR